MLKWNNVWLIFVRELRDQLRDRRTLFMVAILPLLLYPALGVGMVQMTILFAEQPRTVVLLGAADLPETPPLLTGNRFEEQWFELPSDASRLEIVNDAPPPASDTGALSSDDRQRRDELLEVATAIRTELARQRELEHRLSSETGTPHPETGTPARERNENSTTPAAADQPTASRDEPGSRTDPPDAAPDAAPNASAAQQLQASRLRLSELFADSGMQVLIIVPEGFRQHLERLNTELAQREGAGAVSENYPRPEVIYNRADDKSRIAYSRVKEVLDNWEATILRSQLKLARLPEEFTHPVQPVSTNLALDEQIAANLWGKMFPALLVIMAVTGAFYPAVDLVAGEKERGTMETLLICPASRREIVLGKFLTVMTFSVTTAVLNLISMGFTGKYMLSSVPTGGKLPLMTEVAWPSPMAMVWIIVLLLPLAALFSALCLALATFARSSKEGQYYLTPLIMVTMGITVFCVSPGIELTPFYSVLPIAGVALLLKGLLLSPVNAGGLYLYILPVLGTSLGYSLLALWWAIEQFSREDILFREAERFEFGPWLKRLLKQKPAVPKFGQAAFGFLLIMVLQFVLMRALFSLGVFTADDGTPGGTTFQLLLVQQLAVIALPAVILGLVCTSSLRETFRLRWPPLSLAMLAVVLAGALHPWSVELQGWLHRFFPPLPAEIERLLRLTGDPNQSLWMILAVFAVAPAICEELAFRGFILSGFGSEGRVWRGVAFSSLAFGLMHMIPQQVFNASLLGVVLGLLAVRSRSLLPGVLFHFVNNLLAVVHGRAGAEVADTANWFFSIHEHQLRYGGGTLVIAAIVAVVGLRSLWKGIHRDG